MMIIWFSLACGFSGAIGVCIGIWWERRAQQIAEIELFRALRDNPGPTPHDDAEYDAKVAIQTARGLNSNRELP